MARPMRPGKEGLKHWHVWGGVDDDGQVSLFRRVRLSFRTRTSADQWTGRKEYSMTKVCFVPSLCRDRVFNPNEVRAEAHSDRLTQEFVDQVKANGQFFDGGGLHLYAHVTKDGDLVKLLRFQARLQGKPRHIRLGSAEALTLEAARVVAAKVMVEFVERRRLLREGEDGNETHAAFLTRMKQSAADAVRGSRTA